MVYFYLLSVNQQKSNKPITHTNSYLLAKENKHHTLTLTSFLTKAGGKKKNTMLEDHTY